MVNFPTINSSRGPVDNNKIKTSNNVRAARESAKTDAEKNDAASQRQQRRKKHPAEHDEGEHNDDRPHIDIQV